MIRRPAEWIRRLRRQAATALLCTAAVVVALMAATTLPWIATTGVAVAGVALVAGMVHKWTHRLHERPACLACGHDLGNEPAGVHGIACPECGAIHSGSIRRLARLESERQKSPLDDSVDEA